MQHDNVLSTRVSTARTPVPMDSSLDPSSWKTLSTPVMQGLVNSCYEAAENAKIVEMHDLMVNSMVSCCCVAIPPAVSGPMSVMSSSGRSSPTVSPGRNGGFPVVNEWRSVNELRKIFEGGRGEESPDSHGALAFLPPGEEPRKAAGAGDANADADATPSPIPSRDGRSIAYTPCQGQGREAPGPPRPGGSAAVPPASSGPCTATGDGRCGSLPSRAVAASSAGRWIMDGSRRGPFWVMDDALSSGLSNLLGALGAALRASDRADSGWLQRALLNAELAKASHAAEKLCAALAAYRFEDELQPEGSVNAQAPVLLGTRSRGLAHLRATLAAGTASGGWPLAAAWQLLREAALMPQRMATAALPWLFSSPPVQRRSPASTPTASVQCLTPQPRLRRNDSARSLSPACAPHAAKAPSQSTGSGLRKCVVYELKGPGSPPPTLRATSPLTPAPPIAPCSPQPRLQRSDSAKSLSPARSFSPVIHLPPSSPWSSRRLCIARGSGSLSSLAIGPRARRLAKTC